MDSDTTICVKRNNDRGLPIVVKKGDEALDITGWSIMLSVKKKPEDADDDALFPLKTATLTTPAEGKASITIDADDTKDKEVGYYYYDMIAVDDQGKRQSSKTGLFKLEQEVTDGDA